MKEYYVAAVAFFDAPFDARAKAALDEKTTALGLELKLAGGK